MSTTALKKGLIPLKKDVVSKLKVAVEASGLPIYKIAKKHIRISSQHLTNIMAGNTLHTQHRTFADIQTFIDAFAEKDEPKDDNVKVMTKEEHDEAHSAPENASVTNIKYKVVGYNELKESMTNIDEVANSNMAPDVKLRIIKSMAASVC